MEGGTEVARGGPYASGRTMHTQTVELRPGATTITTTTTPAHQREHRAAPHHHPDTSRHSLTSAGEYTFTVIDSYGDGMCCQWGNGNVSLAVDGYELWTLIGCARSALMPLECPRVTDLARPRVTHRLARPRVTHRLARPRVTGGARGIRSRDSSPYRSRPRPRVRRRRRRRRPRHRHWLSILCG